MSSDVEACDGCFRKYCLTVCTKASFFKAFHHLVLNVIPRARKVVDSSAIMI